MLGCLHSTTQCPGYPCRATGLAEGTGNHLLPLALGILGLRPSHPAREADVSWGQQCRAAQSSGCSSLYFLQVFLRPLCSLRRGGVRPVVLLRAGCIINGSLGAESSPAAAAAAAAVTRRGGRQGGRDHTCRCFGGLGTISSRYNPGSHERRLSQPSPHKRRRVRVYGGLHDCCGLGRCGRQAASNRCFAKRLHRLLSESRIGSAARGLLPRPAPTRCARPAPACAPLLLLPLVQRKQRHCALLQLSQAICQRGLADSNGPRHELGRHAEPVHAARDDQAGGAHSRRPAPRHDPLPHE